MSEKGKDGSKPNPEPKPKPEVIKVPTAVVRNDNPGKGTPPRNITKR